MSHKQNSPDFYKNYPALFHSYFPQIKSDIVRILSEAGYSYYQSILQLDAIIDNKEFHRIFYVLNLQEDSIKKLSSIYAESHIFWVYWEQRKKDYQEAIILEKNLWQNYSEDFYFEVADKKSAFGKIAIDCLFSLTEKENKTSYDNLIESHKYFSIGFQIYDDVMDFREDYTQTQFNLAVFELSKKIDFEKFKDVEILNKIFYVTGLGFSLLQKAIDSFETAKKYASDEQSGWYKTINEMQQNVLSYHDTTYAYIETLKKKSELKKKLPQYIFFEFSEVKNYVIQKGLQFIQQDFTQNYIDLQHFMWLSNKEDFNNKTALHVSDTFQRAMLNDCLIDISTKFSLNTKDFFEKENQYLLKRRNNDKIGAWSYFPTVKEIASDIDDLGQIIQQFIRTQNTDLIVKHCEKAIKIAINERTKQNGGIETWIIPKENKTKLQEIQDHFNETKWGKGPNVEVVANFLYALFLFDAEKYCITIKNGIDFIISEQKADGHWESRWYYGNFYGTYVCLRLLECFSTLYSEIKLKAIEFLKNSQNGDGSFGEEEYKILSTAFARLSLKDSKNCDALFEYSKEFLLKNQAENGSWLSEDFIKPKANQPYKSKTLTTAFVLKSLL